MAPAILPGISADEDAQNLANLANQHLTYLKTLLDDPSGPFATIFPGKTTKDLHRPEFLSEAMYMAQLLAKDDVIANLNDRIAEKDGTIVDLKDELDANGRILALRDKRIVDLERKLKDSATVSKRS